MTVTVTLFNGFAGWITGLLAIIGAGTMVSGTWDWARERYSPGRPVRNGWAVRLPDGTRGVVTAFFPAVYEQAARVLLESISGPGDEFSGYGTAPQAVIVPASDCTRVRSQSLREAIRSIRPTQTSKDA